MKPPAVFKDWKHDFLFFEERPSAYEPGGYHPISFGDKLDQGRYEIRHKLGYGAFSTVWLARDTKLEIWVAIKLIIACKSESSQDISAISALQGTGASSYVVKLLDSFIIQGSNGIHQCLVLELLGPTLDKVLRIVSDDGVSGDRLEPETTLRIIKQLLQAVISLHKAGYVHGDITTGNIVFTSDNVVSHEDFDYTSRHLAHMSEKEIVYILGGPPEIKECVRLDGKPLDSHMPRQIMRSATWDDWVEEDDEDIRLVGLGSAIAGGSCSSSSTWNQVRGVRTPEAIFNGEFDYRADLFRVGCVIYTLLFAEYLVFGEPWEIIMCMINLIEELPTEWQPKLDKIKETYGRAGEPDTYNEPNELKSRFHTRIQDPSLKKLFPVLEGLMRLRPADRIEASVALELVDLIIRESRWVDVPKSRL